MHMHYRDRNRIIAVESLSTREHLIHHCADRVDIASCVGNVSACLLGTDIVNASDSLIGSSLALLASELGNTEVHDLDSSVCEHHNVLRLDIAVNNALVMSVLKCAEDLDHEMDRILPCKNVLLLDILLEGDTVNVFHNDILYLLRESHIVNFNDIRVRENCYSLRFIAESAQELLILCILLFKYLNGNGFVVDNIDTLVNLRHTANANKLGYLISSIELLANVLIHFLSS